SIMPGKVNPVIPEAVNQVAFQIIANDTAITLAAMSGQLELNAFMPVIAKNLFEELDLLSHTLPLFIKRCVDGIKANEQTCRENLENSTVMLTALTTIIGYDKGTEAALILKETGKSIKDIILEKNWMTAAELDEVLKPERLTSPSTNRNH
ncbi:MAG: aspartate ammonia-lyase, partial [Acetobacterium sp.]|nr:aspartate ammonia-lyase [Acetobacterium sp.]